MNQTQDKPRYVNIKLKKELIAEIDKFVEQSPVYSNRVDVVKKALDMLFTKDK